MITVSDLLSLARVCPAGGLDVPPIYAVGGGSAVLCHLHNRGMSTRGDIDLFVFEPTSFENDHGKMPAHAVRWLSAGSLAVTPLQEQNAEVHIVRGVWFDCEIAPGREDARWISIQSTNIPCLTPEYLAVSKLAYPNVHRSSDFSDVLLLNQNNQLQNMKSLERLLACTAFGQFLSPSDVTQLRSDDDLRQLIGEIQFHLIRRFLRSDLFNVEILTPKQVFVLVDQGQELIHLSTPAHEFIRSTLDQHVPNGRARQLAALGMSLIAVGMPPFLECDLLADPLFVDTMRRLAGQVHGQPYLWLSRAKSVLMTIRELAHAMDAAGITWSWLTSASLATMVDRLLFGPISRFLLRAELACYRQQTEANPSQQGDPADLVNLLRDWI